MCVSASENPFRSILKALDKPGGGEFGNYYSLPALNDPRIGESDSILIFATNKKLIERNVVVVVVDDADKLPYSIRILLESAIRNCDEFQVKSKDVEKILDWENTSPKQVEIPFKPARVLLQVNAAY